MKIGIFFFFTAFLSLCISPNVSAQVHKPEYPVEPGIPLDPIPPSEQIYYLGGGETYSKNLSYINLNLPNKMNKFSFYASRNLKILFRFSDFSYSKGYGDPLPSGDLLLNLAVKERIDSNEISFCRLDYIVKNGTITSGSSNRENSIVKGDTLTLPKGDYVLVFSGCNAFATAVSTSSAIKARTSIMTAPTFFVTMALQTWPAPPGIVDIPTENTDPPSEGKNYILTRTYTNKDGTAWQDKIDYFDGLGRLEQSISKNASPQKNDLITLQEYDNLGRESNQWMPVVIPDNKGQYVSPDIIKNKTVVLYGDAKPYSMPIYEPSPLNRLQAKQGVGQDWHSHSRSVKMSYLTNISGNDTLNCVYYTIKETLNDTTLTLTKVKNYNSAELYVTRTEDEDGNASFEFKDKLEQVVLTRQIQRVGSNKEVYDTYYIYNDFGNRVVVLPPAASDEFRKSSSTSWESHKDPTLKQYAFLYKFDSRNREMAKKLPGCSWTLYVYDQSDHLIFSQDGNQRKRGEWTFSIPDVFGRECFSGICKNSVNPFTNPLNAMTAKATWQSTDSSSEGAGAYKGYYLSGVSLTSPTILSVNYYDDYSFMGKNGIPESTNVNVKYDQAAEAEGFGEHYAISQKGLTTGTLTALLDNAATPTYLYSILFYDDHHRVVQTKSNNHLPGGVEKEYYAYNFMGQPIKRKRIHAATGKATQTELYTDVYDHAGRLLTTKHQLNNGAETVLMDNEYDELGQLKTNKRNGQENLKTGYTYNIRAAVKTITNPLFKQTLYYNDLRKEGAQTNTPRYNGNISGMDWVATHENKERGYDFTYDNLSRLTQADYLEGRARNNKFNTAYTYDKQGNMLTLARRGNMGTSTYETIDNLTLSYQGNQLIKAEDAAAAPTLSMSMDFKDGVHQSIEYTYDENGNQVKDLNKGISNIEYNILNLPHKIAFNGTNNPTNEYVYSADGKKLAAIHKASITKRTDYVGNMIYVDGSLKMIQVDGGYYEPSTSKYYFYITDHLGSNRVVADQSGNVIQTNHYYPYGLLFAESAYPDKQSWKYIGKELDTERGLNWYDLGARLYDGIRMPTPDPIMEKYYSWSPYAYCMGNPVSYKDPTGMFLDGYIVDEYGFFKRVNNEGGQAYDVIYSKKEYSESNRKDYDKTGNKTGIQISKNILNGERTSQNMSAKSIKMPVSDMEGHSTGKPKSNQAYEVKTDAEASNIMMFLDKHTKVEWGNTFMEGANGRKINLLMTSHEEATIKGGVYQTDKYVNNGFRILREDHIHPGIGYTKPSGGDLKNGRNTLQRFPGAKFRILNKGTYYEYMIKPNR